MTHPHNNDYYSALSCFSPSNDGDKNVMTRSNRLACLNSYGVFDVDQELFKAISDCVIRDPHAMSLPVYVELKEYLFKAACVNPDEALNCLERIAENKGITPVQKSFVNGTLKVCFNSLVMTADDQKEKRIRIEEKMMPLTNKPSNVWIKKRAL